MPDPTSHIRFGSVLPKKAWVIFEKPTRVRSGWLGQDFGLTHLVRKQAGVRSGITQHIPYQFPTFRLCHLLQMARIILCKTSPDPVWIWLTVSRFGQLMDPVWKQAGVQKASGPILANASEPVRIGSDIFTGTVISVRI